MRRLLCHEPRGHADMYGCFPVPPDDAGADSACCSGTRTATRPRAGTARSRSARGRSSRGGSRASPTARRRDDRRAVRARRGAGALRGGAVESVTFRNVPAYVIARGVNAGGVSVDVATAAPSTPASAPPISGSRSCPSDWRADRGGEGDQARAGGHGRGAACRRATLGHLRHDPLRRAGRGAPAQRHGVRRRRGRPLAVRLRDLGPPRAARPRSAGHESIVGTTFSGRIVERTAEGVITEIEGTSYRTGEHRFVLDPRDELARPQPNQ